VSSIKSIREFSRLRGKASGITSASTIYVYENQPPRSWVFWRKEGGEIPPVGTVVEVFTRTLVYTCQTICGPESFHVLANRGLVGVYAFTGERVDLMAKITRPDLPVDEHTRLYETPILVGPYGLWHEWFRGAISGTTGKGIRLLPSSS